MNSITFLVFKKELMDIFRDRKTIIVGVLIPLIIFPIIFNFMGKSMNKSAKSVENNLKIAIVDSQNSELGRFIKEQKNVNVQESSNLENDVKEGKIYAGIEIPSGIDASVRQESPVNVTVIYDNSSQQSQIAMGKINSYITAYSQQIVTGRLMKRNIDVGILNPVIIKTETATKESEGFAKFMLSLMLPMLLVIYSVTGPLAAATDLGAGEKERGTLEPLLTTQASRMSLLWGKFWAITVMGLITSTASLIGMFIAITQKDSMFMSGGNAAEGAAQTAAFSIEPKALLLIGLVAVLTTMIFGALELAISIYARAFKEAQTYISPLTIIAIIPTYAMYMIDAKNIETFYFHIPLANTVCILKELIAGIYRVDHMIITLLWTSVYIVASVLFARFMFSREEVIFRT